VSADPARAGLDARLLAWMRDDAWRRDDARFEALALELFAFQYAHCAAYQRFCDGRGRSPASVRTWTEIPAVPTGAFKEVALTSFPLERAVHVFRTSGTTTRARGALHLDTLALYEASLLPAFRRHLLPDCAAGTRIRMVVVAPSPEEAPDSSLSHMFGVALRALGTEDSDFCVRDGAVDVDRALGLLESAAQAPLLLCGTAFGLAHLLDALDARGRVLSLPASTRLMETGGFKGRARETSREDLYARIEARLGIPASRCVNQYGMTELGSQFYDSVLREPGARRRKLGPPWARVRLVDPDSGEAAAAGAPGAIVVFDLANTGSVLAIQTADLGRSVGDGFEVIGREPGAEERGCSIAADALLAGATDRSAPTRPARSARPGRSTP
jgi:acyl-CoA synthetase (AMP-forming)/AMP-acid ligase II